MFWLSVLVCGVLGSFDFIVVGSGPGGGSVAVSLAKKGFKTLLMEAGPDAYNTNNSVPVFHAKASEDSGVTFDYSVQHNAGEPGVFYPRVGALGGCSIHNAMLAVYPNSRDFETMKRITGSNSWDERNMRRYFKALEKQMYRHNLLPDELQRNTTQEISQMLGIPMETLMALMPLTPNPNDHGSDGWLTTSPINLLRQLALDPALAELLPTVLGDPAIDMNGYTPQGKLWSDQEGRMFIPQSVDPTSFTRANFPAHLKETATKYPLTIWTDTFVTKVLFKNTTAVGVEYVQGKHLYRASPLASNEPNNLPRKTIAASMEIILSAGAFNTPQLLMLSGIGDKSHLASFNIPLVSDVWGVGRNLMDRYEIPIVLKYPQPFSAIENCTFSPTLSDPCYRAYLNRKGPYISNGIFSGQLKKSSQHLTEPDLFIGSVLSDFHGYFRGYAQHFASHPEAFTKLLLKARTQNSFGEIHLLSPDPFDTPSINFHSFEEGDADLEILTKALQHERKLLQSLASPHTELYPGPQVQTDDEVREYIRTNAWGHHACCTARIGPDSDMKAVLDPQFRVRGVQRLRVIDASAFPEIPGLFPVLYLHMFAMKAADTVAPGMKPITPEIIPNKIIHS
ncbi:hypothetical protein DSO57_1024143 [Entomophthora muscae]|uniref:Uncharacterized protein n=1 Tax=Entomophthora muscae TaxID=34485 RepID=A0ACC2UCH9_9FUNG|nr:hypothetical protein DSO57_1024143 [Entomophthora muscae]